jgi:hypothetical protein
MPAPLPQKFPPPPFTTPLIDPSSVTKDKSGNLDASQIRLSEAWQRYFQQVSAEISKLMP